MKKYITTVALCCAGIAHASTVYDLFLVFFNADGTVNHQSLYLQGEANYSQCDKDYVAYLNAHHYTTQQVQFQCRPER